MDILQHDITGELYAAAYADGMSFATLDRIAGPLDASTALEMVRDAYELPFNDDTTTDLEWARHQPWGTVSSTDLFRRAEAWV